MIFMIVLSMLTHLLPGLECIIKSLQGEILMILMCKDKSESTQ